MSAGKTMVSYVVGHAICDGYIESINSRLNDWPLLENTLYFDSKLIDILNMKSGDQEYIVGADLSSSVDKSLINQKFRGLDDYALDLQKYMLLFKKYKKIQTIF